MKILHEEVGSQSTNIAPLNLPVSLFHDVSELRLVAATLGRHIIVLIGGNMLVSITFAGNDNCRTSRECCTS